MIEKYIEHTVNRELKTVRSAVTDIKIEGTKLVGLAVPFNQRSSKINEFGESFYEYIRPDALDFSGNVRFCYDHNEKAVYGDTDSKTLTLRSTAKGIEFEMDLPEYATELKKRYIDRNN